MEEQIPENPGIPMYTPQFAPPPPNPVRRIRRQFSRAGWALFTAGLSAIVVSLLLSVAVGAAAAVTGVDITANSFGMWLVAFFPTYGIGLPLGMLILKGLPGEPCEKKKLGAGSFWTLMLMCVPITVAGNIVGSLLAAMLTMGQTVNPLDDIAMNLDPMVLFSTLVLAPVLEELVFRKMLLDRFAKYGEGPAILFGAMAFALFHGNLYQMVYAFGLGVLFGFVYQRTHRIHYTMAMHFIVNFFGSVVAPLLLIHSGDPLTEMVSGSGLLTAVLEALPLMCYETLMTILAVWGLVVLLLHRKDFRLESAVEEIPRGYRRKVMLQNPGVIVFMVFCILESIAVLVQGIL